MGVGAYLFGDREVCEVTLSQLDLNGSEYISIFQVFYLFFVVISMNDVYRGSLIKFSGFCTGIAVLFSLFSHKVSLGDSYLMLLDSILPICVVACFVLHLSAFLVGLHSIEFNSVPEPGSHSVKKTIGAFVSIVSILCGWLLLDFAPSTHGAIKTATTLGALLSGLGVVVLYIALVQFFKRRKE